MDSPQPQQCSRSGDRTAQLRAELKQWERDFAASHDGRKAGRDDIKQFFEIASKYKAYDKSRQPSSPKPSHSTPTSKRRSDQVYEERAETPSKRAKHAHPLHSHPVNNQATTSRSHPHHPLHPALLDPYDHPSSTTSGSSAFFLSPSRVRTSLGPTPQRDGHVLGLFDALSSSGGRTPTKKKRQILDPIAGNNATRNLTEFTTARGDTQVTPSKKTWQRDGVAQPVSAGSASKARGEAQGLGAVGTPSNRLKAAQKQQQQQNNCTPVRDKHSNNDYKNDNRSSRNNSSKVRQDSEPHFDETPAFLRRNGGGGGGAAAAIASRGAAAAATVGRGGGRNTGNDDDDDDDDDDDVLAWSPIRPSRLASRQGPGSTMLQQQQQHNRHHRPLAGKGLSALVRGLREMEDARYDEDLELLREMEGGGGGGGEVPVSAKESFAERLNRRHAQMKMDAPEKMTTMTTTTMSQIDDGRERSATGDTNVLVEDSQAVAVAEMPLGPDGFATSDDDDDHAQHGKRLSKKKEKEKETTKMPTKIWKKKGQKRTTRQVKMRPNVAKWVPEPVWKGGVEDPDEGDEDADADNDGVGETQLSTGIEPRRDDDDIKKHTRISNPADSTITPAAAAAVNEGGGGDGGGMIHQITKTVKKKTKKLISATAHANFRALKIRGKNGNSKGNKNGGGGGGRGRFGKGKGRRG